MNIERLGALPQREHARGSGIEEPLLAQRHALGGDGTSRTADAGLIPQGAAHPAAPPLLQDSEASHQRFLAWQARKAAQRQKHAVLAAEIAKLAPEAKLDAIESAVHELPKMDDQNRLRTFEQLAAQIPLLPTTQERGKSEQLHALTLLHGTLDPATSATPFNQLANAVTKMSPGRDRDAAITLLTSHELPRDFQPRPLQNILPAMADAKQRHAAETVLAKIANDQAASNAARERTLKKAFAHLQLVKDVAAAPPDRKSKALQKGIAELPKMITSIRDTAAFQLAEQIPHLSSKPKLLGSSEQFAAIKALYSDKTVGIDHQGALAAIMPRITDPRVRAQTLALLNKDERYREDRRFDDPRREPLPASPAFDEAAVAGSSKADPDEIEW